MTSTETLPNGLHLVVEPRASAPVVALWLRLGVGALRELPGEEGAAHFVEHMLFKGSRAPGDPEGLQPGEIGPIMDALGADLNAYTSHEETVIHCVLPCEHAETALRLLGWMVFRCWFDPEQVERERAVVLDELARGQDDPARQLAEGMARRTWGRHPYGRTVLGSKASVGGLDAATLRRFHARWYRPGNAHLVVVGDIEPALVRQVIASPAFEPREPPLPAPPPDLPPAPEPQRQLRFVRMSGGFEEQILELAMRIPSHGHPDLPAIDLLCSVLGEGASALLPQRLHVERGVAHGAWAVTEVGTQGGLLVCGASPSGDDPEACLEELAAVLHRVREHGVPVEAFQRAKANILADRAYSEESAEGRASVLSFYLGNYGSAQAERDYRGRVDALRLAEVDRAARTWLRPERATVGVVGQDIELGMDDARFLLAHRAPRRRGRAAPASAVQRRTMSNGVRVVVEPLPDASITSLRVLGCGGSLLETPATAGHGRAWAELLTEGCGHLDAAGFAQAIEGLSGSLGGFATLSVAGLAGSFPSDRFTVGLQLLLLPLLQPRFDEDAVERVRASMEDAESTRADSGASMAWDALLAMAFPGHPYRLPGSGTQRSIARIDAGAMQRVHRKFVRAENLVVAVSGAVEPEAVFRSMGHLLEQLPEGATRLPKPPRELSPRRRHKVLQGSWQQAQLVVGFRGRDVRHEDRPALDVLGALLGTPGGRLFQRLREEAGLSYDVQASHMSGVQGGLFTCSLGAVHGRMDEAVLGMRETLVELLERPPEAEELDRAVAALAGGASMDLQRSSYRAARMAQDERFGLDGRRFQTNLDDVRGVTLAELHAVAARYLAPGRALWVTARKR